MDNPVAEEKPVESKPVEAKPKRGIARLIKIVLVVAVLASLIIYLVAVFKFQSDSIAVVKSSSEVSCNGNDYCITVLTEATGDGWARWKLPVINVSVLSFSVSSTFKDGDKVQFICPVAYNPTQENELTAKLKLIQGQVDPTKCHLKQII